MSHPIPQSGQHERDERASHPRRRGADRVDVAHMLALGGQMAARISGFDWSRTPLGPLEEWPISLRSAAAMLLENRFPMALLWGPDLLHLHNDTYVPILGAKHPAALGQPASVVWAEIWPIIGAQLAHVRAGKGGVWNEHLLLPMDRKGFLEETYFTFSYSPVRDDAGAIGGVLATCYETTFQVQDERQLQMLRDLGAEGIEAESVTAACRTAAGVLGRNDADIPFALIYLVRPGGDDAELVASAGLDRYEGPANPAAIPHGSSQSWPLAAARAPESFVVIDDLGQRFGALPQGRWKTPPGQAVILSLAAPGQAEPYGFLVAAVSPMRILDERYRRMFRLTVDQIEAAIGAARAFEEERTRVEALAALDRAKTGFFSNVSHEFRTPLLLMLAPTTDLLDGVHGPLSPVQRAQLELVQRNANRLHKLVDSLLDITRLDAGRAQPRFEPVDLAALTHDLAASFLPAIERAGLTLRIDCPSLDEPVFVDRGMWEKIVLNLISNAIKFTFEGTIAVSLHPTDGSVVLRVEDTGVGIAAENIPHLYDRFFRVEGGRARVIEGSGIGLALVQELVKLHQGTITVASALGQGTTFSLSIPRGSAHLPADRIAPEPTDRATALGAAPFVEEAMRWLPGPDAAPAGAPASTARVLVVDDNRDVRDYVRGLLEPSYQVEAVADGAAALAAVAAWPPDLVLTDAMMPGIDGFELLRRLRAQPETRAIPVVILSARAGDEAKVEGLQAGADDYLTKPFSARELIARVGTQLKLARLRARAESERERFYELLQRAPVPIAVYDGPELRIAYRNQAAVAIVRADAQGKAFVDAFPELVGTPLHEALRRVYETGEGSAGPAVPIPLRAESGLVEERIFNLLCEPLRDDDGRVTGVIGVAFEITDQVRARRAVEHSEARFRTIFETAEVSIWEEDYSAAKRKIEELAAEHGTNLGAVLDANPALVEETMHLVRVLDINPATVRMFGASSRGELLGALHRVFDPGLLAIFKHQMLAIAAGERLFVSDAVMQTLAGDRVDLATTLAVSPDDAAYAHVLITLTDVSAQKLAARERDRRIAEMERAVHFGEMFAGMLGHDLRNPLSAITTTAGMLAARADSDAAARPARRVLNSAHRMERMIAQLLDFTRVRLGGGLPVERTRCDLVEICRSVIEELEPVHKRQIRLRTAGDVAGAWDRDRLSQMLSNLAGNACQHATPDRPIEIRVDGTTPDRVRIDVHNDGVIPPELIPTLFEPLRRSGESQPRRGGSSGLGLGLFITQQIALAHGGTIAVISTEADGTSFVVDLPRGAR